MSAREPETVARRGEKLYSERGDFQGRSGLPNGVSRNRDVGRGGRGILAGQSMGIKSKEEQINKSLSKPGLERVKRHSSNQHTAYKGPRSSASCTGDRFCP
ncbi:uncharacterized [Tachysurus ichikawai]